MRKIALCLSGQPRYVDDGFKIIKKHLSSYDLDVFIHTWWDNSQVGETVYLPYDRKFTWQSDTIDKIKELYNPISIEIEAQRDFENLKNKYLDVDYQKTPKSCYSMFYSIYKSNELKKKYEILNEFKYDLVIRCRFDIDIKKFDIDLEKIENSFIYMNEVSNRVGYSTNHQPNDLFAISSSSNMDYYSNLYNKIDDYYNEGLRIFVGEHILKHHLDKIPEKIKYTDVFFNSIVIKNE